MYHYNASLARYLKNGDNNCNVMVLKASEELEDRETLAQMAASNNETHAGDGESYIEKYIKGVSAVESILALDKLRQVR